jgi:hypothetical protein
VCKLRGIVYDAISRMKPTGQWAPQCEQGELSLIAVENGSE